MNLLFKGRAFKDTIKEVNQLMRNLKMIKNSNNRFSKTYKNNQLESL